MPLLLAASSGGHLTHRVFGAILRRIWALPLSTGWGAVAGKQVEGKGGTARCLRNRLQ